VDIFSSGYFIPLCLRDFYITCKRTHSLWHSRSRNTHLVFLGGAYRESLGESTGTPFYFLCLPLYVEGTSLTTSLSYQDAVLASS
jgi:hypothetical protein